MARSQYPEAVVTSAVYWLSRRYTVERRPIEAGERLTLKALPGETVDEAWAEREAWLALNDANLREQVRLQTKDLQTILYAKAFAQ